MLMAEKSSLTLFFCFVSLVEEEARDAGGGTISLFSVPCPTSSEIV